MSVRYRSLAGILVIYGFAGGIAHASENDPIVVIRSTDSIVLEGRLDEPAWQRATAMKLVHQSPQQRGDARTKPKRG